MNNILRLQARGMSAWCEMLETSAATWTTLAHRLPMLAENGMASREGATMVSEKVDATVSGAMDAGLATMQIANAAMLWPLTPNDFMLAGMRIAEAATLPARRKVKANALRLATAKGARN